jgi:SAM-dependent methyltransferase
MTGGSTVERPAWAPPEVDLNRPSPARIYDYMLGGSHHFAVDREMAQAVLAAAPAIRPTAHANRAFLRRAVEFLVKAGIRQFLDIGSGIPTVGNVHEVAQHLAPEAKVVYVDIDPVAVAHSRAIVGENDRVVALQADFRKPDLILDSPTVRELLDFDRPIAILLVGLLHFVMDAEHPVKSIARLRDAVPAGSYLVIAQVATPDSITPEQQAMADRYTRATPVALRPRRDVLAFFDGFDLVEPGLVDQGRWDAEPDTDDVELVPSFAGVGIKRSPTEGPGA